MHEAYSGWSESKKIRCPKFQPLKFFHDFQCTGRTAVGQSGVDAVTDVERVSNHELGGATAPLQEMVEDSVWVQVLKHCPVRVNSVMVRHHL